MRLLRIRKSGGEYYITLVTNIDGTKIDYVALSYCWGGDQVHKMTSHRLKETSCVITFIELPKTIQDAVTVTNSLGYSYLWVDSLCIIQDDETDKTTEIAKMPLIYSNAIVTIAAAAAHSTSVGFLGQRQISAPVIEGIQIEDEQGKIHTGGIVELDGSDPEILPLETRAWALQEAFLSARVLEYRPL